MWKMLITVQSDVFRLLLLSNEQSKAKALFINDKEIMQILLFQNLEPANVLLEQRLKQTIKINGN